MRFAGLLRLTAIGIVLLCWLDPPVIVSPIPPVVVDTAVVHSPRDDRPAADVAPATIADARAATVRDLADGLGPNGSLRVHDVMAGDRVPCDTTDPCVIVTDGASVTLPPDRKGPVSIVRVGEDLSPNVEATGLSIPSAHLAGQATARLSMRASGVAGRTSRARLFDGEAVVGEAIHEWTGDGEASLEVPWWPIAPGARTLVARIVTEGGDERTPLDDEVAARAAVEASPWPVITVERRASWAATFVRRAIEDDARFAVATLTDLAPRVSVSTAAPTGLDRLDAVRVVVVGAPEALTSQDVDHLDAFVRQRGGAVVLLPDQAIVGPATRLLQHRWRQQSSAEPSSAGPLRASEWWLATDVGPLDLVWARSEAGATVVATPAGAGIVLVSGALDAWRHRTDDGAYDDFWRATIARLASGVGPAMAIEVSSPAATGDETAQVQARTAREAPGWRIAATRTCADGSPSVVRMWPADAAGAFWGRVPTGARTDCRVDARVDGMGEATAAIEPAAVGSWSPRWTQAQMAAVAADSGGQLVTNGDLGPLVNAWFQAQSTERRPESRYPMRSWWWLLPLVASLAGEWLLRRQAGLR